MTAMVSIKPAARAARFAPQAGTRATAQVPEAGLFETILDDLSEASWLVAMSRLGQGLSPELIALHELEDEPGSARNSAPAAANAASGIQPEAAACAPDFNQTRRVQA